MGKAIFTGIQLEGEAKRKHDEFSTRLRSLTDEALIEAYNREVGNPGWVSVRGIYLSAMHEEFLHRAFENVSEIATADSFSLNSRIALDGNTHKIRLLPKKDGPSPVK